jgi:hypothetical protein
MFADTRVMLAQHSPEILVGVGIAGMLVSTVLACRATLKAPAALQDAKDKFNDIEAARDLDEYSDKDRRHDLVVASSQTAWEFTKIYGPAAVIMGASVYAVLKGHGITMERNKGLTAALTVVSAGYRAYRDRVAERYGAETEEDIYLNRRTETREVEVEGKNGKMKTEKQEFEVIDIPGHSAYAKFFDDQSKEWSKSPEQNLMFLRLQQNYANDMLLMNKVVFLNEVYDLLGLPRTSAGQVVGWAITSDDAPGDKYIDFGFYNQDSERVRAFVNGNESSILLDFNVDGPVYKSL